MKRPFESYLLMLLLLALSVNAIYGGGALIIAPDGSLLGMEPEWLTGSPFGSYLLPGILLALFLGVLPLVTLAGLISKGQGRTFRAVNIYPGMHWGWTFSIYTGIATLSWIIVQQLITSYHVLQPVIAAAGLMVLVMTLLPRIQDYDRKYSF